MVYELPSELSNNLPPLPRPAPPNPPHPPQNTPPRTADTPGDRHCAQHSRSDRKQILNSKYFVQLKNMFSNQILLLQIERLVNLCNCISLHDITALVIDSTLA